MQFKKNNRLDSNCSLMAALLATHHSPRMLLVLALCETKFTKF